ncbi:hypothetical protein L1887_16700 [Cichorium endivia]|nr:hypothetical protein L1887_16700 [Cichorium endivia]
MLHHSGFLYSIYDFFCCTPTTMCDLLHHTSSLPVSYSYLLLCRCKPEDAVSNLALSISKVKQGSGENFVQLKPFGKIDMGILWSVAE